MGLYDEYEKKEQHNYLAVKNNGNIILKNMIMFENYSYALNDNNIPSLLFLETKENKDLFKKLKNKPSKLYWAGFLVLAFEHDDFQYGFTISEIQEFIFSQINFYMILNEEIIKETIELNLTEL